MVGFSFKKSFGPAGSVAELVKALDKLSSVVGNLLANRRCEACEAVCDNLKDIHTGLEKYVSSVIKLPATAGEHRQLLRNNIDNLVILVRAEGPLLWYMFQHGAISREEKEACSSSCNGFECTRRLLDIIQTKAAWVYETFLNGLAATEQQFVCDRLSNQGACLDMAHAELIRKNYCFLMDNLIIEECLVSELYASSVFDQYDLEKIGAEVFHLRKLERFLDAVMRKSPDQFKKFLHILQLDMHHENVVAALMSATSINSKKKVSNSAASTTYVSTRRGSNATSSTQVETFAYQERVLPKDVECIIMAKTNQLSKKLLSKSNELVANSVSMRKVQAVVHHPSLPQMSGSLIPCVEALACSRTSMYLVKSAPAHCINVFDRVDAGCRYRRSIKLPQLSRIIDIACPSASGSATKVTWSLAVLGRLRRRGDHVVCLVDVDAADRLVATLIVDNQTARHPISLSVSSTTDHVIVTYSGGSVCEFSPSVDNDETLYVNSPPTRHLQLPVDSFGSLSHAVHLSSVADSLLVCHGSNGDSLHRVCSIVTNTSAHRVLPDRFFGAQRGAAESRLNQPRHLAVDDSGARVVYVADSCNRRVVALNADTLVRLGAVSTGVPPRRVCSVDDHLFVGLDNGEVSVYRTILTIVTQ